MSILKTYLTNILKKEVKKMGQKDFIQKAINIIFAADAEGYPLPAHTKISKLQILTSEYLKTNKQ